MAAGSQPALSSGPGSRLFSALLVYYWALQFVMTTDAYVERGGVIYFLYVVPIAVFSLLLLGAMGVAVRLNAPAWLTGVYACVVCVVALARTDYQTIASTLLFSTTVLVVFAARLSPPVGLLNRLFLISILVNGALFLVGRSIYAVIPGFSTGGEFSWRVSLFPLVATSAFFSLIVLFLNLLRRDTPLRTVCLVLSLYFLILSGIRSALVAGVIGVAYLLMVRVGRLQRPRTKMAFLVVGLSVVVVSLFASQVLLLLPGVGGEGLNTYLFRSGEGFQSQEDAARGIYRTWLWAEHLRLAGENPLFGVGTFDLGSMSSLDPMFADVGSGSEAFITGLFARVGLAVALLVAALLTAIFRGLKENDHARMVVGLAMFVAMLAYGSFVNVYDFVFLVMLGLLAARSSPPSGKVQPVPVSAGA